MHKQTTIAAVIAFPVVFALIGSRAVETPAQEAKFAETAPTSIANGKIVFVARCSECHGAQAQGSQMAPAISPPPSDLPGLISYARNPTGKMPPVPVSTASDGQFADVYAFLESIAPNALSAADQLKGNADNGKKLFTADGCYECHGRRGNGGTTGPRIGPPVISLDAMLRYVRAPTGQMPPYTSRVASDQDLVDIYTFLKSIPEPSPAQDIPLLNQ